MNMDKRYSVCRKMLLTALALLVVCGSDVEAWSTNQKALRTSSPSRRQKAIRKGPSSKIPLTSQNMMPNPVTPRINMSPRQTRVRLSHSVLASCDTLPKFPTAHGMLSTEIVGRMEQLNCPESRSPALDFFLKSYRKEGPMSCLPMLSDPQILPYLTEAMRDTLA